MFIYHIYYIYIGQNTSYNTLYITSSLKAFSILFSYH